MSKQLSLDRDFTRFLNDPTFPYKVTVCIGNERILCSGALLAQQSSVLEKKMREDDGVLMFEEMLDVENKNNGIHACIRFLHGAAVNFVLEDLTVILKFASFYEVKGLFEEAMKWLRHHLKTSRSVEDAIQYLKLSNCFHNSDNNKKLKSEIQLFIKSNKEIFCSKVMENLDSEIAGFDIINIINEDLVNSGQILKKWASFSIENRSYIIKNHSSLDLITLFQNEEEFSSFICLISEGTTSAKTFKALLDLQKAFLTLKLSKSSEPNIEKLESKDNVRSSGSGLNPNSASSGSSFSQNKADYGKSLSTEQYHDISAAWPRNELETNVRCPSSAKFPPNRAESESKDNVGASGSGLNPNSASSGSSFSWNKADYGRSLSNMYPTDEQYHDDLGVAWPRNELNTNVRCQSSPIFPKYSHRAEFSLGPTHNEVVVLPDLHPISKRSLIMLFSFAGRIISVEMFPGEPQTHVTFEDVASAHKLLKYNYENENAFTINDNRVTLYPEFDDGEWYKKYSYEQVLIWNITSSTSEMKLRKLFSFAGQIASVDILPQDFYAVITYHNVSSATTVRASGRSFNIDGVSLDVNRFGLRLTKSSEKTTDVECNETRLYIGNIPVNVNEEQLRVMFSGFGQIIELKIIRRVKRGAYYGFITFHYVRSARKLLQCTLRRNFTHKGYCLKIERSKPIDN